MADFFLVKYSPKAFEKSQYELERHPSKWHALRIRVPPYAEALPRDTYRRVAMPDGVSPKANFTLSFLLLVRK